MASLDTEDLDGLGFPGTLLTERLWENLGESEMYVARLLESVIELWVVVLVAGGKERHVQRGKSRRPPKPI